MKKLNKKNLLAFADHLYSEKNGRVYYQPLSRYYLVEEREKEIFCCVLGEMYHYITGEYISTNISLMGLFLKMRKLAKNIDKHNRNLFEEGLSYLMYLNDSGNFINKKDSDEKILIDRAKRCSDHCRKIANSYLK